MRVIALLLALGLLLPSCEVFVHDDTPDAVVVEKNNPDVVVHETQPAPPADVNVHVDGSGG
jgi:hypothetical protein